MEKQDKTTKNEKQKNYVDLENCELISDLGKYRIYKNDKNLYAIFSSNDRPYTTFMYSSIKPTVKERTFIASRPRINNANAYELFSLDSNRRIELLIRTKKDYFVEPLQIENLLFFEKMGMYDVYDLNGEFVCKNLSLNEDEIEELKIALHENKNKTNVANNPIMAKGNAKLVVAFYILFFAQKAYDLTNYDVNNNPNYLKELNYNYFAYMETLFENLCNQYHISESDFKTYYLWLTTSSLDDTLSFS